MPCYGPYGFGLYMGVSRGFSRGGIDLGGVYQRGHRQHPLRVPVVSWGLVIGSFGFGGRRWRRGGVGGVRGYHEYRHYGG